MRKQFIVLVFISIFLASHSVNAQSKTVINSLRIQFWPEHDQAEMLVIAQIELHEDTSLPARINFKIPATISKVNAVAIITNDNVLKDAPYQIINQGNEQFVELDSESHFIQIEYYDSNISIESLTRTYSFLWDGTYQVDEFQIDVIPPRDGMITSLAPLTLTTVTTEDGFVYSHSEREGLNSGEEMRLVLSYTRPTTILGVSILQSDNQNATVQPSTESVNNNLYWIILLIIVGVVFVAVRQNNWQSNRTIKKKKEKQKEIYCRNCGTSVVSSDKFCRKCGKGL